MMPIAVYDAVFLAAAVTLVGGRRGRLRWVALIPLVAAAAMAAPLGVPPHLIAPMLALIATMPPIRAPGPALVLAAPIYGGFDAAAMAAGLYLATVWLADGLDRRIEQRGIAPSWRGAPARLLLLAVLYATLLPVGHL